MKIRLKYTRDYYLSMYIVIALYLPIIKFCVVQSIPGLLQYNSLLNLVIGIFLTCLFCLQIKLVIKRSLIFAIINILVLVIIIISAFLSNQQNINNTIAAIPDLLILSSSLFLITISINDYEQLFELLLKYSSIVITMGLFMLVCTSIIGVTGSAATSYNMSLSYYCLIPTMIS